MIRNNLGDRMRSAGIVPVVTIEDAAHAVPLARALAKGGMPVVEVTLRTDAALESIRRIAAEVPDALVGAGTVRRPADIDAAVSAGAKFLVSPGTSHTLSRAGRAAPVTFLPGCATPSEALALAEMGFEAMKFFPASAYGGPGTLKALLGPLAGIAFVPTGGVGPDNLADYLGLSNVLAVGGSWMVRPHWLKDGDYATIEAEARAASAEVRRIRQG